MRHFHRWMLLGLVLLCVPRTGEAQVAEADAAWNQGRYGDARAAYLRALVEDPASVRAAYRLGVLAAWDGNLDSALTLLAQARTADPDDPDVRAMQATVLTWGGRYRAAIVQWDSLITMYPSRVDGLLGKARTLAWDGQPDAADSLYAAVLVREPTNVEAMSGRAQLAFWDGRTAEAVAGYRRALTYQPRDVTARIGLAQVYRAAGRQLDAMSQADSARLLAPGNRDAEWAYVDIARTALAAAEVSLGWSDDSDDNEMWWQVVSASTQAGDATRVFGSIGAYEGSSAPAIHASRGAAEFGATRSGADWQLTGAVGAQGLWPDSGLTRTVLTARLGGLVRLAPGTAIGLSFAHLPFAETATLIGSGIDIDAADLTVEAPLGNQLALSAGGGAGWYSDGNVRTSAVLAVTKQLPAHFFAGGLVRMVWYSDPQPLYFSPDRFAVLEARGGYARTGRTWETRVSAGLGGQQIGVSGGWQFEGHAEGRVAWWFAARNRLEAFAGVSNSAYLSATGAYRWGTAGLVLRLGI